MEPVSPVMPGSESIEVVYGKGQKEYQELPAVYLDTPSRPVLSRWRLTDEERMAVSEGADIVLTLLSFQGQCPMCHTPLTPSHLQVVMPDAMPVFVEEP
jgi:hypothetical protein